MKQKTTIIIIIFIAMSYFCIAEKVTEEGNTNEITYDKRVSVYWHPLTTIFSLPESNSEWLNIYLYATAEVPLSSATSLIIRPSYWEGIIYIKSGIIFGPTATGKRIGSDIGVRYYAKENGKGFYGQGQIGLFHYYEETYHTGMFGKTFDIYDNFIWFDIIGYVGWVWQFGNRFRMFLDFGMGYVNTGGYNGGGSSIGDINLGVGILFGKNKTK